MNKQFIKTIEKYNMLTKGDRVVVGVSGGADSMLLLNLLLEIKNDYDITVEVAHIEHGIRGKSSVDDAKFVENFCIKENVPFHLLTIDATAEAKIYGKSVEEYSRIKRYEFFNSLNCDKIATAHNFDDNIETVLFRLSRGTGLKGACGIPAVRDNIIRPLIEITSKDIRSFCDDNDIQYRIDETNLSNEYSRNYIRNVIVNDFEKLNDSFCDNLAAFIEDCKDDYDFIESASQSAYIKALEDNALDKNVLKTLHPAVSKRVINMYFEDNGVALDRLHLNECMCLIDKSSRCEIKKDIFALSDKRHIRIAEFNNSNNNKRYDTKILKKFEFNPQNVDFYCDYDKINGSITVRNRLPGDYISPAGRGIGKTLKKLLNECGVDVEKRDSLLIICDEKGVIGVEGICCDERVKPDDSTENFLIMTVSLED